MWILQDWIVNNKKKKSGLEKINLSKKNFNSVQTVLISSCAVSLSIFFEAIFWMPLMMHSDLKKKKAKRPYNHIKTVHITQTVRCNKRNETLNMCFQKRLSAPLTKQQTFTFFKEYNEGQLISFWDKKGHSSFLIMLWEPQLWWKIIIWLHTIRQKMIPQTLWLIQCSDEKISLWCKITN